MDFSRAQVITEKVVRGIVKDIVRIEQGQCDCFCDC